MRHASEAGIAEPAITPQFAVLLAILAVSPLPLGGNRPWAVALLGLFIAALFVWHVLSCASDRGPDIPSGRASPAHRARWTCYALGAWTALLGLQLVPLPHGLVSALQFDAAGRLSAPPGAWTTVSIDPYSTRLYFLKALALLAFFWLVLRLACTARRIETLAKAVILCGGLQAVLGIALFALNARYSIFFVKVQHSSATGTYVNHNHYAGYLEMALAVGIGLMMAKLEGRRARSWKQWARDWLVVLMSEKARLRIMLLIMVLALIASRSRMGNAAFFFSLLIAGAVAIVLSKRAPRSVMIFIASLVVLDIVIIGSVVGLDNVMRRLEQTRLLDAQWETQPTRHQDAQQAIGSPPGAAPERGADSSPSPERQETLEQRTQAARAALPVVASFPVLGTGGGTFHMAFPPFRPPELRGYFDHVHNDFVEIATETGLAGLALLAFAVAASAFQAVRILVVRHDPLARGMGFAALMGTIALMIHSAVDFNLQIPANAMLFLVLLALPYLVGSEPRRRAAGTGVSQAKQLT